ncbi:hypothetical protein CP061683_0393B, partial [Chlamydia psittaci 06-1683]
GAAYRFTLRIFLYAAIPNPGTVPNGWVNNPTVEVRANCKSPLRSFSSKSDGGAV